jgi:hypothetical protein
VYQFAILQLAACLPVRQAQPGSCNRR